MGTFEQGYMGPFRGKLGTAVGSRWKGLYVLRSRPPRKRSGPASESQLEVQAKFLLMTKFLRPLTDLLNQTFKKSAVNMSGANKAFAENKKAVTGAYPDFAIDYAKVILSTGNFDNAGGPAAKSAEAEPVHRRRERVVTMILLSGARERIVFTEWTGRWEN